MDYSRLSKVMSHALRHKPEDYGIVPSASGWVPVSALLEGIRAASPEWASVTETELRAAIAASEKRRHKIVDGQICSLYGHSSGHRIERMSVQPPGTLYHGTAPHATALIRVEGLTSMARHYVHLSLDAAEAQAVGLRKASRPVVLRIKAQDAWESGTLFYEGGDRIWLADHVPPEFVSVCVPE